MGVESSRVQSQKSVCTTDKKALETISSLSQSTEDWGEVAVVSWNTWMAGIAENFGFDIFTSWLSQNLKVNKKPWSKFMVTAKQPCIGCERHICNFTCEVEETGREEKVSWWIKNMSVIGMSQKLLVVQVIVAKAVKILVVDWQTDKLLGTYSFASPHEACMQECLITPDSSLLLLRQNSQLRGAMGHMTSFDPNIKVIQVKEGLCQRLYVIEDTFVFNFFGSGLGIDPRIPKGYLAVISSMYQPVEDAEQGVRVYDLTSETLIKSTRSPIDKVVHHCQYSPDGTLIAVLCIDISQAMWSAVLPECVHILDSNTFEVMRLVPIPFLSQRKPVFNDNKIKAIPFFSRDGKLMAQFQLSGSSAPDKVVVYKVPYKHTNLQDLCRRVVLKCVPWHCISKLNLPYRLSEYLWFR